MIKYEEKKTITKNVVTQRCPTARQTKRLATFYIHVVLVCTVGT